MTDRLRYALGTLNEDSYRRDHDFTPEVRTANEVLINNPYANDVNREEALNHWIQRFQPCLFGKVAAVQGRIHYCFISDSDLALGEQWVASKIHRERRHWKSRAVDPSTSGMTPAHSFVLHVSSGRVARAAPDNALCSFALLIRELWGCPVRRDPSR